MSAACPRRFVLLAGAALGGCSVLPERAYQERREWPLDAARPIVRPAPPHGPALLVRGLRAGPGLDARGLRSILPDGAEHLDFWEEWTVPPPQAVEASLRQWLAASGLFSAVIMPGSEMQAQFVLEAELTAFAADLRTGQAAATLSLALLRRAHGEALPVVQRSLTGEAPLSGHDGPAIAAALRAATEALLGQVEALMHGVV